MRNINPVMVIFRNLLEDKISLNKEMWNLKFFIKEFQLQIKKWKIKWGKINKDMNVGAIGHGEGKMGQVLQFGNITPI